MEVKSKPKSEEMATTADTTATDSLRRRTDGFHRTDTSAPAPAPVYVPVKTALISFSELRCLGFNIVVQSGQYTMEGPPADFPGKPKPAPPGPSRPPIEPRMQDASPGAMSQRFSVIQKHLAVGSVPQVQFEEATDDDHSMSTGYTTLPKSIAHLSIVQP